MTDPDSVSNSNTGSGQAVTIRMVGYDKPLMTAIILAVALAMSGLALIRANDAKTEARMAEYYYVECIQNGICKEVKRGE